MRITGVENRERADLDGAEIGEHIATRDRVLSHVGHREGQIGCALLEKLPVVHRCRCDFRGGLGVGTPDLVGILTIGRGTIADGEGTKLRWISEPWARFFALEVKTGRGTCTKEQQLVIDDINRRGGFAAVVKSEAGARWALTAARTGVEPAAVYE